MSERIDKRIKAVNSRLKAAHIRLRIVRRRGGKKLSLRGTFPPKPGSGKTQPSAGWLSLGINATYDGVGQAEKEARRISGEIDTRQFEWGNYIHIPAPEELVKPVGHYLDKLQHQKLNIDAIAESTWRKSYYLVFQHHLDQPLTPEVLEEIVLSSKPDSRTRVRRAIACGALADVAGLDGQTFRRMKGKYSVRSLEPRELPDDTWIPKKWREINDKEPEWGYVFALMAVYGLRNHEVFYTDLSEFPILRVTGGKTGPRDVYPFYPEWAEEFQLNVEKLPVINRQDNTGMGDAVGKALKRYGVGKPYNLRHQWAVRTIGAIPQVLAAAMMGHSVAVHNRIYQNWMGRNTLQAAFELYLNNPNRPKPPK